MRFPLLAEEDYDPHTFLYTNEAENGMPRLADWIQVFRSTVPAFQKMAEQDVSVDANERPAKAAAFANRFGSLVLWKTSVCGMLPAFRRCLLTAHSINAIRAAHGA